jgi:hypothetical protein
VLCNLDNQCGVVIGYSVEGILDWEEVLSGMKFSPIIPNPIQSATTTTRYLIALFIYASPPSGL